MDLAGEGVTLGRMSFWDHTGSPGSMDIEMKKAEILRYVFFMWSIISLWPLIFLKWDFTWYWIYLYSILAIAIVLTYRRMKKWKDATDEEQSN